MTRTFEPATCVEFEAASAFSAGKPLRLIGSTAVGVELFFLGGGIDCYLAYGTPLIF